MWHASALYSVAGGLGKIGALITVPVVTRALGRSDYGLLDLATALIALSTLIGGFSAELPAARLAAADGRRRPRVLATYVATVTLLSLAIALTIAIGAPLIADSVWNSPAAAPLVLLSSAAIALTGVQLATWNVHRLRARAGVYAVLSIIDMVLKISLILLAVSLGLGVEGILGAYIAAAAVGAGLGLVTVRKDLGWPPDVVLGPRLIGGGAAFTVTAVAFVVAGYWVRGFVADAGSTSAVGEMAIAVRIGSVLALPLASFQFAWAPVGMTADPSAETRSAFFGSIFGVITVGSLVAMALSAFSPEIIQVFAGSEFAAGGDAVPGLALACVLNAAFFMLAVAAAAAEMSMRVVATTAIGGSALQIFTTAWLLNSLPEMTAVSVGAAIGNTVALLTLLALRADAVERFRMIGAASVGAVAATLAMQALIASDAPSPVRWGVGVAALIAGAYVLARGLSRRRRSAESAAPSQ
jgi:O-antigen/teichoic acid export membrane protein